jgi:predicted outer membrane repeat protein
MYRSRQVIILFTATIFLPVLLSACNPAQEINVPCSVADLIQAINTANANSNATVLNLPTDCVYPFTDADNSDGGHGANALPIITTDIRINGNDAWLERTSDAIRDFRFFLITDTGSLSIDNMSLVGGRNMAVADEIDPGGGAIYNEGALTLSHVLLQGNWHQANGGAIFNAGILFIDDDSRFEENRASNGGAIFNADYQHIPITIYNSSFLTNLAFHEGGAIYNRSAEAEFIIGNVDFRHNTSAYDGGAIYAEDGRFTIAGSDFQWNGVFPGMPPGPPLDTVLPDNGGAVYIENGSFDISRALFGFNQCSENGGAIYNLNGTLSLHDEITFRFNTAGFLLAVGYQGHGGAIYNEAGILNIVQAYFLHNTAGGGADGGAIFNQGLAAIQESAFEANSAYHGGAVMNRGQLSATNVSFSANAVSQNGANIYNNNDLSLSFVTLEAGSADRGNSIFQSAGSTLIKNSILDSGTFVQNCDIAGGSFMALGENIDDVGDCPGILTHADPLLDIFTNNGGFTPTFALLPGSPAIDGASSCTDVGGNPVGFDQRHADRVFISGLCDIGAYEAESQLFPAPSPQPMHIEATETPTPTPTVVVGCLVQQTREGDTLCVVPCPEGAVPGDPCTP